MAIAALAASASTDASVGTGKRAQPDDQHRPLGAFELLQEGMRAVGDLGQCFRTSAEIVVRIGEIGILADQPDRELASV